MSWDGNNLAPHALPSILYDSLSPPSAGLKLGRHLGWFGMFSMVAGNGLNTSQGLDHLNYEKGVRNLERLSLYLSSGGRAVGKLKKIPLRLINSSLIVYTVRLLYSTLIREEDDIEKISLENKSIELNSLEKKTI